MLRSALSEVGMEDVALAVKIFGFVMFDQMKVKLCNTHEWCEVDCSEPHTTLKPDVLAPPDARMNRL